MKKDYKAILEDNKVLAANSKHFFKYVKEDVKELIINSPQEIHIQRRDGNWEIYEDENLTLEYVERFATLFSLFDGKRYCKYTKPLVDFDFCGIRFQIVGSSKNADQHIYLAARVNIGALINLDDLVYDTPSFKSIINILKSWAKYKKTFLIAGATGTGKTTLLNAILAEIDQKERLVAIESVPELKLHTKNRWRLIYDSKGPDCSKELYDTALRASPDRVIVGELKQENVAVFLQAIESGHEGSIGTIHADSLQGAINTIVRYSSWSGEKMDSRHDIVQQLSSRLEGVVILKRTEKGVSISLETNGNTALYQDNIVNIEENSKFLERVNL